MQTPAKILGPHYMYIHVYWHPRRKTDRRVENNTNVRYCDW